MSNGNSDRIETELNKAALSIPEKYPGYRDELVKGVLACITDTTEHDERRLNINQKFDARIDKIAEQLIASKEA